MIRFEEFTIYEFYSCLLNWFLTKNTYFFPFLFNGTKFSIPPPPFTYKHTYLKKIVEMNWPNSVNCIMSFSELSVSFYIYITITIFVFHLATYSLFWALLLSVVSKHPPFCLYRKRPEAAEVIKRLERNPSCQGLPMISFLLLPMQRITRLPLLVDAICHRLEPDTPKHRSAGKALDALNKVDPSYKQVPLTNRSPYKVGTFSTSCAVRSWTPLFNTSSFVGTLIQVCYLRSWIFIIKLVWLGLTLYGWQEQAELLLFVGCQEM